jgi:hypothetical protein
MEHAKLGALASACGVSRDTLKYLAAEGFIPVATGGTTTGDHRRFDLSGIVTAASICGFIASGLGRVHSARLVDAIRAHRLCLRLASVEAQFRDSRWRDEGMREWQESDTVVEIADGRWVWLVRTNAPHKRGTARPLGRVDGDLNGHGGDVEVHEVDSDDLQMSYWSAKSHLHPRSVLRVNISLQAREVMRRLMERM